MVICLNRLRSPGMWASKLFLYPMPLLRSVATIIVIISDRYFSLYCRVGVVTREGEVIVLERKDIADLRINIHHWQGAWLTRELKPDLLNMIKVYMCIAECMNELTRFITGDLCHHQRQECIRCNVKRHAEENVSTALVELA